MITKKISCFVCVVFINGWFTYSQTNDAYEFPIKRGTEAWRQLETNGKRIAALQIPEDSLAKISTEGLLETCLEFPYLFDIFFGSHAQHGFEVLTGKFNGLRELLKRPDLTNVLLEKYRNLTEDVKGIRSLRNAEQGSFTFRHFALEMMLAQDVVLQKMSMEQDQQLFLLCFEHQKIKQTYSDIFSYVNNLPTYLLYAKKIMNDSDFKFENVELKEALSELIQTPIVVDPKIIEFLDNYINYKYKFK